MAELDLKALEPNSKAYKEKTAKKPKLSSVVSSSNLVSTKKSLSQKFAETFLNIDRRDLREFIMKDLVMAGIEDLGYYVLDMIFDNVSGGRSSRRKGSYYDDRTSYSSYYRSKDSDRRRRKKRDRDREYEGDRKLDYKNIVVRDRREAERIVDELRDRIHEFDTASVGDLFDLIGVSGEWNDNNWGWDREDDICLRKAPGGWLIDVAEAKYLKD